MHRYAKSFERFEITTVFQVKPTMQLQWTGGEVLTWHVRSSELVALLVEHGAGQSLQRVVHLLHQVTGSHVCVAQQAACISGGKRFSATSHKSRSCEVCHLGRGALSDAAYDEMLCGLYLNCLKLRSCRSLIEGLYCQKGGSVQFPYNSSSVAFRWLRLACTGGSALLPQRRSATTC